MAHQTEIEAKASRLVGKICKPAGCVYVDPKRDKCTQKYSDEVIADFETDGCSQASLVAPNDVLTVKPGKTWVIPVTIYIDGSIKRHVDTAPIHKKSAKMY